MAVLALVGAVMTGCSSDEDGFTDTPQQPAVTNYSVTKMLRVSLDGGEAGARGITRALTSGGVKTFAVGDQMAVAYMIEGGTQTKAVTEALKAGDISGDGKTATFTVTFTEAPWEFKGNYLYYTYPASITTANGGLDYSVLNTQDGTLATLASSLDCCMAYSGWNGKDDLPGLTLTNRFTIGKFTIKNPSGTAINDDLTSVTISDGSNTYTITPTGSTFTSDPIWVAMQPVYEGSTVTVTATDGTNNYSKTITIASGKDLLAGSITPINVTMALVWDGDLAKITSESTEAFATATDGMTITGTLAINKKISIAAGATVTLDNVSINADGNWYDDAWAGLTCLGDATIILSGTNTVKGFNGDYPGIQAAHNDTGVGDEYTLTIQGTGSLTASSNGWGAGIGGGWGINCGNIVINGGSSIEATGGDDAAGIGGGGSGGCGDITISGGNITANGGIRAAGIGTGFVGNCGDITIYNTVTSVWASKGTDATNSIGTGYGESCGTVTIGGTVYWNGSSYQNGGDTYLPTSPLVYPAP